MKKKRIPREVDMGLIDEPVGRIRLEIVAERVQELADNIDEIGLLQPIVVRPVNGRFEIVAGHRRFLAFKTLGRRVIPCFVDNLDDEACAFARASENLRRVDLSPIEEAATYQELIDKFKLTPDQIGKRMGKTTGVVKRRLDLLKMPPQLQQAIHAGKISYGVAEELWRITDLGQMDYYLSYAIEHGITVAVARDWVSQFRRSQSYKGADVGGGGGIRESVEARPVYVTCDICHGAEEVSGAKYLSCCSECHRKIVDAQRREGH